VLNWHLQYFKSTVCGQHFVDLLRLVDDNIEPRVLSRIDFDLDWRGHDPDQLAYLVKMTWLRTLCCHLL